MILVGVWLLKERPRLAKNDEDDEDWREESEDQETAETTAAAAPVLPRVEKNELFPAQQNDKACTPRLEVAVMMMIVMKNKVRPIRMAE